MEADDIQNDWIDSVVNNYRHLNFVDRIARPQLYPTLPISDDSIATHLMSWSTIGKDRTPIVYPSVIYNPDSRSLVKLDGDQAYQYAIQSGEYIPFATELAADKFSKEYKRYWRNGIEPTHRGAPPQ